MRTEVVDAVHGAKPRRRKELAPYDPQAHEREQAAAVERQTAHWVTTFEQQVAAGVAEVMESGLHARNKNSFDRKTAYERLVFDIQSDANCIRSWWAWGEPSAYGKAICKKLRVEKRIRAQVLIRARKLTKEAEDQ